jgi:hypothetical protein
MTTRLSEYFLFTGRWYQPETGRLVTSSTVDGRTIYHVWDDRHDVGPREYLACRTDLEEALKIGAGYSVNREFPINVKDKGLVFSDEPEEHFQVKSRIPGGPVEKFPAKAKAHSSPDEPRFR